MNRTITAHLDGKVIIPDKLVKLPVGKPLRIVVEVAVPASGKRNGKKARKKLEIIGSGQFDSGVPDLATNKKYMEGFGKS